MRNGECPHGHKVVEEVRGGWVHGVASCTLCAASGWAPLPFKSAEVEANGSWLEL